MPSDLPVIVAVDLGAESCRVSLLCWERRNPRIVLVHRFGNAPIEREGKLYWDLERICSELQQGLYLCASQVQGQIASIGVDGWAVDYVRLNEDRTPLAVPYCYRDARTEAAEIEVSKHISPVELFALSGVQPLRLNTLYQLVADRLAGVPDSAPWVNLPEYVLMQLGADRIAEFSNATHTGLVDAKTRSWSKEVFGRCGLDLNSAPKLIATGTTVGRANGILAGLAAFREAKIIAPCCHDTASAVAGIPLHGDDWAYISSGTWSLVGTLLDHSINSVEAFHAGFTNLGAVGGQVCFHKNVNGMWLLKQCHAQLSTNENTWGMADLIGAAERLPAPRNLLHVDDPDLLRHGSMASRINAQLMRRGLEPIEESVSAMPQYALLIFHSLVARYREVLEDAASLSGKRFKRLSIVGGGSQNQFLNRLASEATGLELYCGAVESSTVGNFAVQLAALEGAAASRERIAYWASTLTGVRENADSTLY
ncbi:MAG TPA: FGGY-family carbohydrate kinase [Pseudacidobacterium sp.]|jgi:rhamnulokinase|nr:FGGY-family carbohydrate kinase [Pseudacidobacterium sp.]